VCCHGQLWTNPRCTNQRRHQSALLLHDILKVVRAKRPRRLECGWIRELGAGFRLARPLCDVRSLFAIGLASGFMRSRADDHGYSSELLSPGTAAYLSIWSGITRRPLLRITASVLSKGSVSQGSPAIQMCERLPGLRRQVRKTNTARLTRRGHAGAKVAQKNPKWWLTHLPQGLTWEELVKKVKRELPEIWQLMVLEHQQRAPVPAA